MKKIIIYLLLVFVPFSCKKNSAIEIKYETPIFEQSEKIDFSVINKEHLFRSISYINIYDSLLIVCDPFVDPIISIFNKNNGQFISSFGRVDKGPGELVTPITFFLDKNILSVYDLGKKALLKYNLDEINEQNISVDEFSFSEINLPINMLYPINDSLFILKVYPEGIALSDRKEVKKTLLPIPPIDIDTKEWFRFQSTYSLNALCPDKTKFVTATTVGGILDVYSITNEDINLFSSNYFYEPIINLKNNIISLTDESILGFCALATTREYLFLTAHGKKNPEELPRTIWKFDWLGIPITSYSSDYVIENFTIDKESGLFYASTYIEGELALIKQE